MITKPHIVTSRQAHIVDNPEETRMKKFSVAALIGLATLFGASTSVLASEQECKKLKNDHDVIYVSKGFCFKDPEAKAKFGNDNCYTTKPKFSEKEQQRLDVIKDRQKELNCK